MIRKILTPVTALCLVLMPLLISATQPASAQFMLGSSDTKKEASTGIELLLEEAKKDGSTVIVVQPNSASKTKVEDASSMRAAMFLQARERVRLIASSAPTLWENIKATIANSSPDGSSFWLIRAVLTALLGLFVGYFVTRPIVRRLSASGFFSGDGDPQTTADKITYLLGRALFGLVFVAIYFAAAMVVAVVLDSGHEPSRRVIFEMVFWYSVYRFMRHGVSWNVFAGEMPKYRLVNLDDEEAVRLHRFFHIGVAICAINAAISRFLIFTSAEQARAGVTGGVTQNNAKLLEIGSATLVTVLLIIYIVRNWKAWQHIVAPMDPTAVLFKLRTNLARLLPIVFLIYAGFALWAFIFRTALNQPSPGVVIAAPFGIFYLAVIVYGVVLICIQYFYTRRIAKFEELAAAERAKQEEAQLQVDIAAGEVMEVGPSSVDASIFEYQPMFRGFFENAALAIICSVALGELARIWGVPVGEDGNPWAAFLDIVLSAVLCWIAYQAVSIFVDKKLQDEGGGPDESELVGEGEGGGAGATRMATLLPILRYALITVIFSIAIMVILSRMGIDIAPIFAGAGVVGIAVGFGAQTLIRDIFSGAFFLMDDAFRKGEYVEIEGIKGTVEKISIRSFQLRHHLGALHTIPFGEIKQLTNYSRDWVLMKLPLRVTYDTDTEKVRKLVKKLGQQLLDHPQVGHTFMQPLKSQGVYKMEDSAMIIRVKFMTKPGEQFVTRKVVYESIQDLFAREGIKFAHKEVTVRLADQEIDDLSEEEKKAITSAARSVIDEEAAAAQAAAGGKAPSSDR